MDRWILCGYDLEQDFNDGLYKSPNCSSVNNASYFVRKGQRHCHTQKISLRLKKGHKTIEQKAVNFRQRQSMVCMESRSEDRLFKKNSIRNKNMEKNYHKKVFEESAFELQELKRIENHERDMKNWGMGLGELMERKPIFLSKKITINYIQNNNHVCSNPEIFEIKIEDKLKEIETSTQARSSVIKTSNLDLELKMGVDFIPFGKQNLRKANSSQMIEKLEIGEFYGKQTKNLDEMQFCRKAESLVDSSEFEEQFSIVLDKLEDYGMKESLMKEPSTPDTVSSEYFSFGM